CRFHVDLVAVPADSRPERRMHPLDRVQVPRGDEDEVARDRLRFNHGARGPFALPDDRELLLLHRGVQALLTLHAQDVDRVGAAQLYERMQLKPMMKKTIGMTMEAFCSRRCIASAFWAFTISRPFPAGTTRIFGSFGSSGLW